MTLKLVRGDITKMKCDAIVNAANEWLREGSGVCGAIFDKAGSAKLTEACNKIGHCDTGKAVITPGFDLSKYIIHAVGPIYQGGNNGEEELLRSCYRSALELAKEKGVNSIAFPVISSGIYGYPKDEAISVASSEIEQFLNDNEMTVYLVFYDAKNFISSSKSIVAVKRYLDSNFVEYNEGLKSIPAPLLSIKQKKRELVIDQAIPYERKLKDLVNDVDESFSHMLLRLIDEKGMSDVETYKRANIDRKLFSKIRSNNDYKPSKATVLSFCIALRLSRDEAIDLLETAGFALSRSNKTDLIVEYFLIERNYDIYDLNETLFHFTGATL
ncbi:MAG: macro domain-containing protein [Erysipelotrichaceae bacterium]|nr:macro domain-containing protein [Erysipelotrichaceae bacterium]